MNPTSSETRKESTSLTKLMVFGQDSEAVQIGRFLQHHGIPYDLRKDGVETQLLVPENQYEAALHWLESESLEEWRLIHPVHH